METIINTLVPVVFLLVSGQALRRTLIEDAGFWAAAEKLTYFVLMPALLVQTLGGSTLESLPWLEIATVAYGVLLILTVALVGGYLLSGTRSTAAVFTSVFQGSIRFNTYIALALAEGIYGTEGLAIGALTSGLMIVVINILCVTVLAVTIGHDGSRTPRQQAVRVIRDLAQNPLLLACLAGGMLNMAGGHLPVWLDGSLGLLTRMALPLALLCVGASIGLSRLRADLTPSLLAGVIQFGVKPALAAALCLWLGLPAMVTTVLVLLMAVPTAPSAYILARRMGGDHEVMASIIGFQTVTAFATLPLTLLVLGV